MSNPFKDWFYLEHRDDYPYVVMPGRGQHGFDREFLVTNAHFDGAWHDRNRATLVLDLYIVPPEPARPVYRPAKRSWSKAMGLRRPG